MQQVSVQLQTLITPIVTGLGYELVGIEHLAQGRHSLLRIYIDHSHGITVDDCAKISHHLSGVMDVEQPIAGEYQLEVSSPGIDRPLFTIAQFNQFVGQQIKVWLLSPANGRRRLQGVLNEVRSDTNEISIIVDGTTFDLALSDINRAKLKPEF